MNPITDNDKLLAAERECADCIKEMQASVRGVAMARQIVGLRDERIKKELAVLTAEFLAQDKSAAASEVLARADKRYALAVSRVLQESAAAQEQLLDWQVLEKRFENAQAMRNDERARMRIL